MLLDAPPLPGDQVGTYTLREVLGVGGMATVYKATDRRGRMIAVKILHPGKAETDDGRRFQREFLTLRELRDENIVQVFEAGVQGDYPWIAMELVDGTDLGTLVEQWEADPPPDRFERVEAMLRSLCQALAHIHAAGLIHRDIKPSNVLVTRDGRAKLTDFGVVKAPGQFTTQLTLAGRLVGTIAFMAPEQITGEPVDARSDLYSLGAVLYVMLTGRKPIQADTIAGYLARHLTHAPTPPSEIAPHIPRRLEEICLNLLRKDPAQRLGSARQVLAALDAGEGPRQIPLHGREELTETLLNRLDRLAQGDGGMLVLTGPEGVGKSSLLAELVRLARASGRDIAVADGAKMQPMMSLRAQLPARPSTEEDLSDPADDLASLIAGQPWTLAIDHLDRLAPMELELLTRVVRRQIAIHGEPLLVIVVVSEAKGRLSGLLSGADTGLVPERFELAPLDARAVTAMLRDRGLSGSTGAALGQRLCEATGGLPAAVVEQLAALVRAGWLVEAGAGELRCTRDLEALREDPLPIPDRERSRVDERLVRLSADARALLTGVAVLGVEAPSELGRAVASLEAEPAARALDELAAAGLVRRRTLGLEEVAQITSERQRDAILELCPGPELRRLHARAAELITRRGRRRPDQAGEEVLRHLLAAGELGRAFPLLISAARRRLAAGQADSANRLLRRASEIQAEAALSIPAEEQRRLSAQLLALRGETAWRQGDLTGAQDAWQAALVEAERVGDVGALAQARAGAGLALAARGEWKPALDLLRKAIEHLPPGDPIWPAAGYALAEVELGQGRVETAVRILGRVLEVAEGTGNERMAARATAGIALASVASASPIDAMLSLTRAASRLRVTEENASLVPVLLRLAELQLADGRLLEARDRALEAERVARAGNRLEARIQATGLAAAALVALGTEAEGRQLAREGAVMARARDASHAAGPLLAVLPLARVLLELGLLDEAAAVLPAEITGVVEGLDAAPAQWLGVRARLLSWRDPMAGRQTAMQALRAPQPAMPAAQARVLLDVARALSRSLAPETPTVLDQAEAMLGADGPRLLRLELWQLRRRGGVEGPPGVVCVELAAQLDQELGQQGRFSRRWLG